jgi:hypothetical protein
MLSFQLYSDAFGSNTPWSVHIDPDTVVSIEEADRRPAFEGEQPVAIITLATGKEYAILDRGRFVGRQIAAARKSKATTNQTATEANGENRGMRNWPAWIAIAASLAVSAATLTLLARMAY